MDRTEVKTVIYIDCTVMLCFVVLISNCQLSLAPRETEDDEDDEEEEEEEEEASDDDEDFEKGVDCINFESYIEHSH